MTFNHAPMELLKAFKNGHRFQKAFRKVSADNCIYEHFGCRFSFVLMKKCFDRKALKKKKDGKPTKHFDVVNNFAINFNECKRYVYQQMLALVNVC